MTVVKPAVKKKKIKIKKKTQKHCDDLLSPIIKLLHPRCLLCSNPTQVAHHHVHKSKSLILRHDMENLINLCNKCHFVLHLNESYHASRIVKIKGMEWFDSLERKKNTIMRYPSYDDIYLRLKTLHDSLYTADIVF